MASRPPFTAAARPPPPWRDQTYAANVGGAFLSLASVLVVSRVLGAEGRGEIAFLTAIAWFTANLATLGLNEANANLAASRPGVRRALATNSVGLALLLGAAALGLIAVLVTVFPAIAGDADTTLLWATLGFLPLLILQPFLRFLVEADYGFRVSNAARVIPPALNVAINGLLAAVGLLTVGSAVAVWLGGQTLTVLLLAWYVQRRLAGFGRPDRALARYALRFGMKAHLGRVMLLGNYRLDQWLLGAISGSRELGLYSVAVAWAEALWYLPTALAAVQQPDLVRARAKDVARQAARIFRVTIVFTTASVLSHGHCRTRALRWHLRRGFPRVHGRSSSAFGRGARRCGAEAVRRRPRSPRSARAPDLRAGGRLCVHGGARRPSDPTAGGLGAALASTLAYSVAGTVMAVTFVRALDGSPSELVPRPGEIATFARAVRHRLRGGGVSSTSPGGDADSLVASWSKGQDPPADLFFGSGLFRSGRTP